MGLTNMMLLPPVFGMIAIGIIQFTASGGYVSVSYLLLGVLLPSSSRSTFTGLVAMLGGLSALTLNGARPYIVNTPIGDAGLFFVFAAVVTACVIYMFFMMTMLSLMLNLILITFNVFGRLWTAFDGF